VAAPDTYPLIREAILHERQVIADYKKLRRQLCPHAIGCKAGRPQALFYQFAGFSEHGLGEDGSNDNWRCLALADLTIIEIAKAHGTLAPAILGQALAWTMWMCRGGNSSNQEAKP
jgi:hypothetical protein